MLKNALLNMLRDVSTPEMLSIMNIHSIKSRSFLCSKGTLPSGPIPPNMLWAFQPSLHFYVLAVLFLALHSVRCEPTVKTVGTKFPGM